MPLFEFRCQQHHTEEHFIHSWKEAKSTLYQCRSCGSPMHYDPSCGGRGSLYFEQGRTRTIWNLGKDPVTISSPREHREAMKRAGVVEAGNRLGEKGVWL